MSVSTVAPLSGWQKAFVWVLMALLIWLNLFAIGKLFNLDTWWNHLCTTTVAMPAFKAPPVMVVIAPPPAPVQQHQQVVQVGGQALNAYDVTRLTNERDAWQRAYVALAREAADNCRRNPALITCRQPAHQTATQGNLYAPY